MYRRLLVVHLQHAQADIWPGVFAGDVSRRSNTIMQCPPQTLLVKQREPAILEVDPRSNSVVTCGLKVGLRLAVHI